MDKRLDWAKTPILDALERHQGKERVSLHIPGHKAGRGLAPDFTKYAGALARLDATELQGLDDLHDPQGVIKEAQELAAAAWGSEASFFLVGGSTVGNLVAVMSATKPGDTVIVGRNAHQSVWNALALAQAKVVAVAPGPIETLPGALQVATVQEAIRSYPDAVLLIITSPTYHGVVSDLFALVAVAHGHGMKVIVDEAHGAHLAFHPRLPASGVAAEADLVVQSAHKMTAAFTQTGLLHVNSGRVDLDVVRAHLRVFQTSSPSYLLLASLDAARAELAVNGHKLLDDALRGLEESKGAIEEALPGLVGGGFPETATDPFKWTVWSGAWGITGGKLARALETKGIFPELYDADHVLFAWSYANSKEDIRRVRDAILQIFRGRSKQGARSRALNWWQALPGVSLLAPATPASAARLGDFQEVAGKIAAQEIVVYPPGIPVILPGEVYTANVLQYIKTCIEYGLRVDGVIDGPEGCAWFFAE